MKLFIAISVLLLCLTACAQPTINATSTESLQASLTTMLENLDGQKQQELNRAVSFLVLELLEREPKLISPRTGDKKSEEAALRQSLPVYKKMHGMNADEIIAYAKKLQQESP